MLSDSATRAGWWRAVICIAALLSFSLASLHAHPDEDHETHCSFCIAIAGKKAIDLPCAINSPQREVFQKSTELEQNAPLMGRSRLRLPQPRAPPITSLFF